MDNIGGRLCIHHFLFLAGSILPKALIGRRLLLHSPLPLSFTFQVWVKVLLKCACHGHSSKRLALDERVEHVERGGGLELGHWQTEVVAAHGASKGGGGGVAKYRVSSASRTNMLCARNRDGHAKAGARRRRTHLRGPPP